MYVLVLVCKQNIAHWEDEVDGSVSQRVTRMHHQPSRERWGVFLHAVIWGFGVK